MLMAMNDMSVCSPVYRGEMSAMYTGAYEWHRVSWCRISGACVLALPFLVSTAVNEMDVFWAGLFGIISWNGCAPDPKAMIEPLGERTRRISLHLPPLSSLFYDFCMQYF